MVKMTLRERILVGIIASGLALALFAPTCDPKPTTQQEVTNVQ